MQGNDRVVRGSSPGGVNFTLTVYPTARAAARAYRNREDAAVVRTSVVDWSSNPPPHGQLSRAALAQISSCLRSTT